MVSEVKRNVILVLSDWHNVLPERVSNPALVKYVGILPGKITHYYE